MQDPYITPRKLLGDISLPIECNRAFICYCPMPDIFLKYRINIELKHRYFIHSHNCHVMFCEFNDEKFIVVAEVYGGPVSVTTVEELNHYGIKTIVGIGFVGSLVSSLNTGDMIYAGRALEENGTTPHYHKSESNYVLPRQICDVTQPLCDGITEQCVWTTNALYREYQNDIKWAKSMGCTVVNMDTSHFYAACSLLNIKCEYYAVVSDVIDSTEWVNELTNAVNSTAENVSNSILSVQTTLISAILAHIILGKKVGVGRAHWL